MKKPLIAIIGTSLSQADSPHNKAAEALGKALIDNGYRLVSGGMAGIMEAACKGARSSEQYQSGDIIGIVPSWDPSSANAFVDIPIATGLDTYRNVIVANSDAVVAIGGGAGTLSEMAAAWILKRMLLAYQLDGWSGKLANTKIDEKPRVNFSDDKVFGVSSAEEVIELLKAHLGQYPRTHRQLNEYPDVSEH